MTSYFHNGNFCQLRRPILGQDFIFIQNPAIMLNTYQLSFRI